MFVGAVAVGVEDQMLGKDSICKDGQTRIC